MKKYLLLRDNKQTGPYSLEEIRELGLKPYDLIWVEGRSAAWRYPGEVDEFKSFAPQVEEQPFDRFYKKPSGETKILRYTSDSTDEKSLPVAEEKQRIAAENKSQVVGAASGNFAGEQDQKAKVLPLQQTADAQKQLNDPQLSQKSKDNNDSKRSKYVSVSMPSGSLKSVNPAPIDQREEKTVQPIQGESRWSQPGAIFPIEKNIPEEQYTSREIPANTKPVLHAIPAQRDRSGNFLQFLAIAIAVVSLVGVGVLIGMGIGSKQAKDAVQETQKVATETAVSTDNSEPVDVTQEPVSETPQEVTKPLLTEQKVKAKKPEPKPATVQQTATEITSAADSVSKVSTETVKVTDPKDIAKQNISRMISASTNDYKVGMFGGIDNVKVTVFNTSDYPIDLVVVDVSYIQNNKKSFKTESLHFNDIAANSSLTLDAPKSAKGIKVKTTVTHIASKTLGVSENLW